MSAGFAFQSKSQIDSMVIELGWAFFCRYEGCFEAFLKRRGVRGELSRSFQLSSWLEQKGIEIPADIRDGLEYYREIRNALHHDDGKSFDKEGDAEIHLMPVHMERFYQLFIWCGKVIGEEKG